MAGAGRQPGKCLLALLALGGGSFLPALSDPAALGTIRRSGARSLRDYRGCPVCGGFVAQLSRQDWGCEKDPSAGNLTEHVLCEHHDSSDA